MSNNTYYLFGFLTAILLYGTSCRYSIPSKKQEDFGIITEDTIPTVRAADLEKKVYMFNNAFLYDSSQWYIHKFLGRSDLSNAERFYAFLYSSYTHKRVFDYSSTLSQIDSAWYYGQKSPYSEYFKANMYVQKALAFFDISQYQKAEELMKYLSANNYVHLTVEYKAKIMMQEGYLYYLQKNYAMAEVYYEKALDFMRKSSPCDLPMIYGKQIELYSEKKDTLNVKKIFKLGVFNADSCGIKKYTMYLSETMAKGYSKAEEYKLALHYFHIYQAIQGDYTSADYIKKLATTEAKYKTAKDEKEILLQKSKLYKQQVFIWVLFISLLSLVCIAIAYFLWQKQKQILQKNKIQQVFTQQLFENTEAERERIARDLHDGVNHELLLLKRDWHKAKNPQEEIDKIIEDIRKICRNLHPIMLQSIGLKLSIETLCEQFSDMESLFVAHQIDYPKNLLSPIEELQVFRIVQEALSNSAKYAQANAAKVSIKVEDHELFVEIRDNGIGFDVKKKLENGAAFGLYSMLERARHIHASTDISSSNKGTIVEIKISIPS